MQKSVIEYRNLTARKRKNSFIAHAAELAGECAPIHAEKIGKCGTRIWQGIHAVIIGRERLQIDFQSITQALLSQNAHLCIESEHLSSKFLHQIGCHLHPAGAAHRAFGKQYAEIEQHDRAI